MNAENVEYNKATIYHNLQTNKPMKLICLLCGRDKFTRKSPHICKGGFRKRKIKWAILDGIALWKVKNK